MHYLHYFFEVNCRSRHLVPKLSLGTQLSPKLQFRAGIDPKRFRGDAEQMRRRQN
jgi:hypothetical protein